MLNILLENYRNAWLQIELDQEIFFIFPSSHDSHAEVEVLNQRKQEKVYKAQIIGQHLSTENKVSI